MYITGPIKIINLAQFLSTFEVPTLAQAEYHKYNRAAKNIMPNIKPGNGLTGNPKIEPTGTCTAYAELAVFQASI